MRLPLVVFVIFAATPLLGQQPAAAKKTDSAPKPKIVAPAPTPEPKRGVMSRIFGKKPTPTPTPAPTPQPVVKPKAKPRPKPKATPAPVEGTTPAPAPGETPTPESETPKPEAPKPEAGTPPAEADPAKPPAETTEGEQPKTTGKPGKPPKGTKPQPPEPVLDDATKYTNARTKAVEDAQIKELKNKADSAIAEDEAHRASVAYNKALFRKIRQLDPSLEGYVEKLEDAMMKRLNAEKR